MKKKTKRIIAIIFLCPALLVTWCTISITRQISGLHTLCEEIQQGASLEKILTQASHKEYKIRSGEITTIEDSDVFDRIYGGQIAHARQSGLDENNVAMIITKPGPGYYACVIEHEDGVVKNAIYVAND